MVNSFTGDKGTETGTKHSMPYGAPVNRITAEVEAQILSLTTNTAHGSHVIARMAGVSQTTILRVWRRHSIDRQALLARNALVEEHRALALRIARSVASGLPPNMRDDLAGVAEAALVEVAARFDPSRGVPFPAYMQQRVRGACIDSIRRRHYTNATAAEYPSESIDSREDTEPSAELQAIEGEMAEAKKALARQLLERLTGRHAVLIWLHYIEGQSLENIAPKFGVVPSRVSQLHREAITKLQGEERPAA